MPRTKCRFQEGLRADEIAAALREGRCHSCSITAAELTREGKLLEICGEEHFSDLPGLEEYSAPVALCPECHHQAHLDAHGSSVPCHMQASRSREWIDWPAEASAGPAADDEARELALSGSGV